MAKFSFACQMSSKNNKYNKYRPERSGVKKDPIVSAQQPLKPLLPDKRDVMRKSILVLCVAAVTFMCYTYTLHNHFTNWDDGLYVKTNPYIKNLTPANLKMILFHNITNNYYHPITMLTIAANYHADKMQPFIYYFTNVVMHLLNTYLMFFLVFILLQAMEEKGYGRMQGKEWLAALGALCYGIHPMHVESVSWLAERKDVMYAFFYFLGLITYIGYLKGDRIKWYDVTALLVLLIVSSVFMWGMLVIKYTLSFFSLLAVTIFLIWFFIGKRHKPKDIWVVFLLVFPLYVCSLLSKPLAVAFPFSLFAIDVLLKRRIQGLINKEAGLSVLAKPTYYFNLLKSKVLLEKAPFFLLSFAAGVWAWHAQKASGSVASFHTFSIFERFIFAAYGFTMYVVKAFVPVHLCSYYPYPLGDNTRSLPFIYNAFLLTALAIVFVPLYIAYRNNKNHLRVVIFGLVFYFFNIVFVLQFVSSGPAIMADRYSYVAYFGIFFTVVYFVQQLWDKKPAYRNALYGLCGAFLLVMAYLCYNRTKVWHSTETLWRDVIAKYPASVDSVYNAAHTQCTVKVHEGVETAYKNLGNYFVQDVNPPEYDSAYKYYEVLEKIHTTDAGIYSNLGNIWAIRHNIKKSLEEYTKSLKLDSNSFDVYLDRAVTYSMIGNFDKAIKDYDRAYRIDSNSEKLLENRAYTYLSAKQYNNSVKDYTRAIEIDPDQPQFYLNRGVAESNLGEPKAALADFLRYANAYPNNANCLFDISVVYGQMKDYPNALAYLLKAKRAGYKVSDTYISTLQSKANNPPSQ